MKRKIIRILSGIAVLVALSLLLVSCGGGGSTSLTYNISGTVSGAVVQGVTITLSGAGSGTTLTDASGNYSFTGLANGSYTVTPSLSVYTFTPTSQVVTVSNANVTNINFTSASAGGATYSISGAVSGAVAQGVTMTLSGADSGTTMTDTSGNYSFTGLANGSYTVTPSLSAYTFTPTSQVVTITGANVTGVNFTSAVQNVVAVTCPSSPAATVSAVGSSSFDPSQVTINAGLVVKWNNTTGINHTVTSDTGAWTSATLNNGTSVCLQFNVAGTYNYHCTPHPNMTGTVTVN